MQWNVRHIPAGLEGTRETLRTIGDLITASQESPYTRLAALKILAESNVSPADPVRAMRALHNWTRRNVAYLPDPLDVELVQSPENTLILKAGDCDDQATLMASFAVNLGIPARLVTIGTDADNQQHIFAEVLLDGTWTAVDTTIRQAFGYRPTMKARQIYDLKGYPMNTLGQVGNDLPITVEEFQSQVYAEVLNRLKDGWKLKTISRADVVTLLDAMNSGSAPNEIDGTLAEAPTRQAANDFLTWLSTDYPTVDRGMTGPGNLSGLFDSIVNAVRTVAGAIPGVGGVVKAGLDLITGSGGVKSPGGGQASLMDIERAINSPTPVDLNAIAQWISGTAGAITWLPVTSATSFLKPPTLPMYLLNGRLTMNPFTQVPFSGKPQNQTDGAYAVAEMEKQFGAGGQGLTTPELYYKLNPASGQTGTGGSLFETDANGLFSNPYVLIGGSILLFLLLKKTRR